MEALTVIDGRHLPSTRPPREVSWNAACAAHLLMGQHEKAIATCGKALAISKSLAHIPLTGCRVRKSGRYGARSRGEGRSVTRCSNFHNCATAREASWKSGRCTPGREVPVRRTAQGRFCRTVMGATTTWPQSPIVRFRLRAPGERARIERPVNVANRTGGGRRTEKGRTATLDGQTDCAQTRRSPTGQNKTIASPNDLPLRDVHKAPPEHLQIPDRQGVAFVHHGSGFDDAAR